MNNAGINALATEKQAKLAYSVLSQPQKACSDCDRDTPGAMRYSSRIVLINSYIFPLYTKMYA
jgi:hypothetical protein